MMGVSLNIPIKQGRLALGTWQGTYGSTPAARSRSVIRKTSQAEYCCTFPIPTGIYLCEHRDAGGWGGGHTRRIVITLQGQGKT